MNKKEKTTHDPQKAKINLTISVAEMIKTPNGKTASKALRHLSQLASIYNLRVLKNRVKPQKTSFIGDKLFAKTGEMVQNYRGFKEILPELLQLIVSFIKIKGLELPNR